MGRVRWASLPLSPRKRSPRQRPDEGESLPVHTMLWRRASTSGWLVVSQREEGPNMGQKKTFGIRQRAGEPVGKQSYPPIDYVR
jgi:hypothetical protein